MGVQVSIAASCIEKERLGYQAISLTHFTDTAEPSIAAGSKVEIGGALYEFTADETGTGWGGIGASNIVYIRLVPSGASISWEYTTTAPTWSTSAQGWYTGANRVIGGLRKNAGSLYEGKWLYGEGQNGRFNPLPIGTILMFDGSGWVDDSTMPGWYACIAANAGFGCPDLVDRFIMGKVVAGAGATGGSNTHTIASGELPPHTHDLGNHTHEISVFGSGSGATWATRDATTFSGVSNSGGPSSNTSGNGGYANTAIDMKPAYYSVIYIRKCL
jgi:hypothetical protein